VDKQLAKGGQVGILPLTFQVEFSLNGVETPERSVDIQGHGLKDVALALTFRSGPSKEPPTPKRL
jgi:hypothetical protein